MATASSTATDEEKVAKSEEAATGTERDFPSTARLRVSSATERGWFFGAAGVWVGEAQRAFESGGEDVRIGA